MRTPTIQWGVAQQRPLLSLIFSILALLIAGTSLAQPAVGEDTDAALGESSEAPSSNDLESNETHDDASGISQFSDEDDQTAGSDLVEDDVSPDDPTRQDANVPLSSREKDTGIAPLNFCALGPTEDTSRFQKQRVVVLDVAEDPSMKEAKEVELVKRGDETVRVPRDILKDVEVFDHAREMLMKTFPMQRHYWVFSEKTPNELFESKGSLPMDRLLEFFGEDRFAAYSSRCADWLAVPRMTRGDATWRKVKQSETKDGKKKEYWVWRLDLPISVTMDVYRRDSDGFAFVTTLEASSQGAAITAKTTAESVAWGNLQQATQSVSVGLPVGCPIPEPVSDAAVFRVCGGVSLDFSRLRESTSDQALSCGDEVRASSGEAGMRKLAPCVVRRAAQGAGLELQLQAKRLCGWRLFSGLVRAPGSRRKGITMGKHEGAHRGQYYIAREANTTCDEGKQLGFARVTRVGPGGEEGYEEPSLVKFRSGSPPVGSYMVEYAMFGAKVGLEPQVALFLHNADLKSLLAYGGAVRLGVDLTRAIRVMDEFWVSGSFSLLFGEEKEYFYNIDGGFESLAYLGPSRIALLIGIGAGFSVASKSVDYAGDDVTLSGGTFSGVGRLGFDFAARPDWNVRLLGEARYGFGDAELDNEEDAPNVTIDGGPLTALVGQFAVSHTF